MAIELIDKLPDNLKERLPSLIAHSVLGANAAIRVGQNPIAGIPAALLLEGLVHSPLANSLGGSAAIVAGYAPLAVASLDMNPLIDWLKDAFKFDIGPKREEKPTFEYGAEYGVPIGLGYVTPQIQVEQAIGYGAPEPQVQVLSPIVRKLLGE
jgi:hypothetical protein